MNLNKTDCVVIGSGPGGEGAAMQLAKSGQSVTMVERHTKIGGGCTHWGTIPSKALRTSIYQLTEALHNPLFQRAGVDSKWSMTDLLQNSQSVIKKQERLRHNYYLRNNIRLVRGHASLKSVHEVEVEGVETIQADNIVIATGSRPYRPDHIDFTHPRIFDSDTILGMVDPPKSMTIYGAGVVGCEYASMFRNLEIKINLVNSRDRLLDFLDDEISGALSYHMRERGVVIRHNENHKKIEGLEDGVVLHLESGKQLKTDVLLWAVGRTGSSQNMGLAELGIEADSRGYLSVNEFFQTTAGNVYAVGDVIGFPSLASAAYTQGRAAAIKILGLSEEVQMKGLIPSGIYTSPEISSVGKTERELTEAKIPYEVGHAQFKHLARAQIVGREVGMLKILFHRETLELLGIHCFGSQASEIVHIGQAIMSQPAPNNTLNFFLTTTFNYPTMAEAYRVAALNGYNRLF